MGCRPAFSDTSGIRFFCSFANPIAQALGILI